MPTEKELADEKRKQIETSSSLPIEAEKEEEEKENEEEGAEGEIKEEDSDSEETNEEVEEKEEEVDKAKEELEAAKADKKAAKTPEEKDKAQRRINRLKTQLSKKDEEIAQLRAQLAAKDSEEGAKYTDEDVQARANEIAKTEVRDIEFRRMCDELQEAATKVDKNFFAKATETIKETETPIPSQMLFTLNELDNKAQVFNHIMGDVDEYEKLVVLPPHRMAIALAKISEQLRPKPKKISRVPPPNQAVSTNGAVLPAFDPTNTKMSDDEWMRKRNEDVARKRAQGRHGLY